MTVKEKLKAAEVDTNTQPTDNQKNYGNYKKGKVILKGFTITIENPRGSIRSGTDTNGKKWDIKMPFSYGYFNGTVGSGGDPIDVFIGSAIEQDFEVYVIDQVDEGSRAFDEHKVMFGFASQEDAKEAYIKSYRSDWQGFDYITTFSLNSFKKWIKNKNATKYPAKKLNKTSKVQFANKSQDRIKIIRLFGEVTEGETLSDLQAQAGDTSLFDCLVIEIASPGGSVSEGLEIMVWLDSLSQQGKQIITIVVANAYSIASLIMLVANIKVVSKHGKVMVHNPMLPELQYVNSNDLEEYLESLRDLEQVMYDLYQIFTGLKKEDIKQLMDNETYLSPQQAVDYGFADLVVDIQSKPYEMASNIKKKINMSKTLNTLNKVIGMVNNSNFINQTYSTDKGTAVEIKQQDPSTYSVGDQVNLEEGEVVLSDGAKLTIKNYTIESIDRILNNTEGAPDTVPVEEVPQASFNEGEAPKVVSEGEGDKENQTPSKLIEKTQSTTTTKETVAQGHGASKWEREVVQDTFEIGTKVEYVPLEEGGVSESVGVGEWLLDDGRSVLTDSDGVIRFIKESPAIGGFPGKEIGQETEQVIEDRVGKIVESKFKSLEEKIEAIVKKTDQKFEQVSHFEQKASEAIETIANTTTSKFKPDAKSASVDKVSRGSIFSQAKQKVGLE